VKDLKYDLDMQAVDGYIAMEALNEVYLEVTLTFLVGFTHLFVSAIDVHVYLNFHV
jgi:hypothetical protein